MTRLEALKALHEAVLPGWGMSIFGGHGSEEFGVNVGRAPKGKPRLHFSAIDRNGNPARAWLIAILKALIAQEGGE